jgi:hypothetical protein
VSTATCTCLPARAGAARECWIWNVPCLAPASVLVVSAGIQ